VTSLKLSLNLSSAASGSSQFTADWGNLNTIDNTLVVFWASTTGAQTNIAYATPITFSGIGKTITVTLSISGTGITAVRHETNGGGVKTTSTVSITDGDILKVGVLGPAVSPITASGNLIVTNTTDGYVIDTIPYTVLIED
jgi:hypothetical protein